MRTLVNAGIFASSAVAVVLLWVGIAAGVPVNPDRVFTLTQPDGGEFAARLHGDEWAHWYETDDGFTIVRREDGYWTYASRDWDGTLVPSSSIVGIDVPPIEKRLRPGPEVFGAAYGSRAETWPKDITLSSIMDTAEIVIILVEFSDTPGGEGSTGPHTPAYFSDPVTGHVFGSDQGKMLDYFDEVSYGQFRIQGVVANGMWHTSSQTELYYGEDCDPGQPCDPEFDARSGSDNCNVCIYELAREAVYMADTSGFDFAPYDTDDDGVIDHVMIIHAGQNQAALGGGPDDIWTHYWSIPGGETVDGKTVENYMMLSEHDAMSVFAHEFAHDLGAPDLYDYDDDSDPVGRWCNMGYNFESDRPPHLCGLLKIDIDADFTNGVTGWVSPESLSTDTTWTVLRLDQNDSASVFITDPAFSGGEYFLIENRQQSGYYDYSVPEAGIIFTHVDMDMPDGLGRFNDGPPNNAYHGAWIERPLDIASPDGAAYSAEDGETRFDPTSIPSTNANGGFGTGMKFMNIGSEGDAMSIEFRSGPTYVGGVIGGNTIWQADDSPFVVESSVTVSDGDTLTIEPGVVVKFNSSTRLLVYGTMTAEGSEADSIVFTSYRDDEYGGDTNQDGPSTGSRGDWYHILLYDADAGCAMTYCKVRYAGQYHNLSSDERFNSILLIGSGTTLTITNSVIEETYAHPTYSGGSYYEYAIHGRSGTVLDISQSEIRNNDHGGLCCDRLTLIDSQILNGGDFGVYAGGDTCVVMGNRITGNGGYGLYLNGSGCQVVADTVDANGGMGIYCANVPTDFHDNVSTGNGDWGYYIPADVVDQVWLSNVMGPNGRNDAIGVRGGSIVASTQWIDEHPYAVFGNLTVPDGITFTLEPGAVLKFNSSTRLIVNGTLLAGGTEADSIIFTSYKDDEYGGDTNQDGSSTGSRGDWLYIMLENADAGCAMGYCKVRYAGQYHNLTSDERFNSILLIGTGTTLTITNSVIEETYAHPTYSGGSYYEYAIHGRSGTILDISQSEIRNNDHAGIYAAGSLTLLNSRVTGNGWTGVNVTTAGTIRVVGDTLLSNGGNGLYCPQTPDEFSDNYSADNAYREYVLPVEIVPHAWLFNWTEVGGSVGALGGSVPTSTTWIDDYHYVIYGNITIPHDVTLTLEPGTIMKFQQYYNMTINGRLVANGTEADSIIFTSYSDDAYGGDSNVDGPSSGNPGDWYHLIFDNTNSGCSMSYCKVRYAGRYHGSSNYYREAVILNGTGTELAMTNCVVEKTGGGSYYPYAVAAYSGSDLQMTDCVARNNNGHGFYVEEPTSYVMGCLAEGNAGYGFYVHPELVGEIAVDDSSSGNANGNCLAIIAGNITEDDSWPNTYTYLANGSITIDPGATLILHKGAVVKFNGNYKVEVQGGLMAQGDAVEKVIFTAFKDDAYGGDTNEDGINTVPAPGDWGQIHFNGAYPASRLGWAVVSYAGSGNVPAIQLDNCDLSFSECIAHSNLDRAILVSSTAELDITNSDIYGNPSGLENQNTGVNVDARNCWWGDPSGPSGVGPGTGDPVSNYVLYEPWLRRSIDNPWVEFTSPSTSGNYMDVLIFDLNEDDFMDLIAGTEQSGLEVYSRIDFETWQSEPSPITTGQYLGLEKGDFNADNHEDLLVCGPAGIRVFAGDGAGNLSEVNSPLVGLICSDVKFAYVDHDAHLDIVGCSGNNGGVWVFYGDGFGNWVTGNRPTLTGTYNRIEVEDIDNDTWKDIIATNAEYLGIHIWYGSAAGTWTQGDPIAGGSAFVGLAVGDVEPMDGDYDIAVGSSEASVGIRVYLNDGAGGWDEGIAPTSVGIYNDVILADLNGDDRLDMAAASQGGGINVWVGTSTGLWNYWYHPATTHIYNGICVDDFTLNGSLDLAGAATIYGLSLWDNLTPGVFQEYFSMTPGSLDFGPVVMGGCAYESFQLENVSADTIWNVVVYTSNPAFTVSSDICGTGPFDMAPEQICDFEVTYCPFDSVAEDEMVIVHSTQSVTHLRLTGEGAPYIQPIWTMDLLVANAIGDSANSQVLTFGGGIGATDSLDVESGEVCLPPWPPSEVFDARFLIDGCEGSIINIHDYYAERDTFILEWQEGTGGYPVTVSWDPDSLPEGTFLISDVMGGAFIDTLNMADTSQVVIPPEQSFIDQLAVTTLRRSTFTYDLASGWHLLSRAVSTDEDSLQYLFPGAVSAFTWSDGYVQVYELGTCIGYWVNMSVDTVTSHVGEKIQTCERTLPAGWSLVGAISDTSLVSEIQQVPSDCITSVFGYDAGYYLADRLTPGEGYWFDISENCDITITGGLGAPGGSGDLTVAGPVKSPGGASRATQVPHEAFQWQLPIAVENADGGEKGSGLVRLGLDDRATDGIDAALGEREVPPWPPSSVVEARLALEGINGLHLDLRPADPGEHTFEIGWQAGSGGYPVTLVWDPGLVPEGLSLVLTDNLDGSFLGPIDMSEESQVEIGPDQAFVTGVRIGAGLSEAGLGPFASVTRFDLKSNVPNPFGEVTSITYDVPRPSVVDIAIYDTEGRRIRVLAGGTQGAGRHTTIWDGCDGDGRPVGSGVYFCRMQSTGYSGTRKLLVLR